MVGRSTRSESKPLFKTTSRVLYAPPGYLLFVREQTLVAQPFDAQLAELRGRAGPARRRPGRRRRRARVVLGLARRRPRLPPRASSRAAARVDGSQRQGDAGPRRAPATTPTPGCRPTASVSSSTSARATEGRPLDPRPRARRHLALHLRRREREFAPVWSPDGRRIVYTHAAQDAGTCTVKDAAGTGEAELLLENDEDKFVTDWSRDGRTSSTSAAARRPAGISGRCRMTGDRKPFPLRKTQVRRAERHASPDGRFLAYPVERVGSARGLRPGVPGGRRASGRSPPSGGTRAVLERRRPRALLPRARRPHDGRAGGDRRRRSRRARRRRCSRRASLAHARARSTGRRPTASASWCWPRSAGTRSRRRPWC